MQQIHHLYTFIHTVFSTCKKRETDTVEEQAVRKDKSIYWNYIEQGVELVSAYLGSR